MNTERINPTMLRRVMQMGRTMAQRDRARGLQFKAGTTPADGEPGTYQRTVLSGLQGSNIFAGLNPEHPTKSTTKALAKRRTRNKQARKSRARNR